MLLTAEEVQSRKKTKSVYVVCCALSSAKNKVCVRVRCVSCVFLVCPVMCDVSCVLFVCCVCVGGSVAFRLYR